MINEVRLNANGISKSYGTLEALQDHSFKVHDGEIVGLLGPNGAGKTTAIRVLTTVLPPTRGAFTLNGISNTKLAEIRQWICVLPESSGYPLHHTGMEYLMSTLVSSVCNENRPVRWRKNCYLRSVSQSERRRG